MCDGAMMPMKQRISHIRNDLIFIGGLVLVVCVAVASLWLFRQEGDTVIVTVDGQAFGEYSMGRDRRVEIRNGDGYNLLVIEDGKAWVEEASCPDGICAAHRPIGMEGESIICLPNKVVVEIRTNGQDSDRPDIIN